MYLFEFLKEYKIERCKSQDDVKEGDIVVCYQSKSVATLGKVVHVGKTPLAEGHEDGIRGDFFVLDYSKSRIKKKCHTMVSECLVLICLLLICLLLICVILIQFDKLEFNLIF